MRNFLPAIFAVIVLLGNSAVRGAEERPLVVISPTPEGYAWWLRTEYHPSGTDVRGIPAAQMRRGWCRVNELRRDMFPAEEAAYFGDSQSPFAVDRVFEGSKAKQTALVGVYESCRGERGAFLLIAAWPEGKPPIVRHLVELRGKNQFGVVSASDDGTVTLQHCLECDHFSQYKWDKSRKRFKLLPDRAE
ncbi:hypothetical protein QRQ56_19145 [Bradyrhizobium sp. U531]|uniref:hypothetical protein n=1 Tax=Bradyrhizobium sp. U531 TaxID=3053458 RepID=UPI003F43AD90